MDLPSTQMGYIYDSVFQAKLAGRVAIYPLQVGQFSAQSLDSSEISDSRHGVDVRRLKVGISHAPTGVSSRLPSLGANISGSAIEAARELAPVAILLSRLVKPAATP